MAFGLRESLEQLLNTDSRITTEGINPDNLSKLNFAQGWQLPDNFLGFSEETADAELDKVTELAEARSHGIRVMEGYTHLAQVELKYQKAAAKLRDAIAKAEISKEEGFGKWQALQNEVAVARRRASVQTANDIEQQNIGYARFTRGLQDRLQRNTDTSKNGTHAGSDRLRGNPSLGPFSRFASRVA